MTLDLTNLLREWPYEPGQINVRIVQGDDGEPKIQMRLDLGVIQMEAGGRPDGSQPHGFESLLDYYETRIEEAALASEGEEGEPGVPGEPVLNEEDCRLLREEAVQYYHRYISLLVLGDYEGVIRDTSRNLRVLDICRQYAEEEDDQRVLEQFRPYITMMRSRALATAMVVDEEPKAALLMIDEGLNAIRAIYEETDQADQFETAGEVHLLRSMREELVLKLPASQKSELRQRLAQAIQDENYELAAILRDELRMMKD